MAEPGSGHPWRWAGHCPLLQRPVATICRPGLDCRGTAQWGTDGRVESDQSKQSYRSPPAPGSPGAVGARAGRRAVSTWIPGLSGDRGSVACGSETAPPPRPGSPRCLPDGLSAGRERRLLLQGKGRPREGSGLRRPPRLTGSLRQSGVEGDGRWLQVAPWRSSEQALCDWFQSPCRAQGTRVSSFSKKQRRDRSHVSPVPGTVRSPGRPRDARSAGPNPTGTPEPQRGHRCPEAQASPGHRGPGQPPQPAPAGAQLAWVRCEILMKLTSDFF